VKASRGTPRTSQKAARASLYDHAFSSRAVAASAVSATGFYELDKDPILATPISPAHSPTHWYTRARLDEISVLPPGAIGWYKGAKVTGVSEPAKRSPAGATTSDRRPAAGEVFYGGGKIIRPGIGQVLGVR
jgi:hypothetical protein